MSFTSGDVFRINRNRQRVTVYLVRLTAEEASGEGERPRRTKNRYARDLRALEPRQLDRQVGYTCWRFYSSCPGEHPNRQERPGSTQEVGAGDLTQEVQRTSPSRLMLAAISASRSGPSDEIVVMSVKHQRLAQERSQGEVLERHVEALATEHGQAAADELRELPSRQRLLRWGLNRHGLARSIASASKPSCRIASVATGEHRSCGAAITRSTRRPERRSSLATLRSARASSRRASRTDRNRSNSCRRWARPWMQREIDSGDFREDPGSGAVDRPGVERDLGDRDVIAVLSRVGSEGAEIDEAIGRPA